MSEANSLNEKQVVCPHCWHRFYQNQAFYISTHPELYGDDVLGDIENKRFAPVNVQVDRTGVATDPKGSRMTERACPVCHLQIPPELLLEAGRILSIVGAPASGKTYFLTSMLHELRSELTKNFGLALRDSDSHEIKVFLDYESTLFGASNPDVPTQLKKTEEAGALYNVVRLQGADVLLPKPLIFSLSPTISNPDTRLTRGMQVPFVLYDNAGESFDFLKEKSTESRVTQHLSRSEAIFFSFDPVLEPNTRQRLQSESTDPQLTQVIRNNRQESLLTELINRIRRQRAIPSTKSIDAPLLVCVQKYDIWKKLLPHSTFVNSKGVVLETVDDSSVVYSEKQGIAGLDLEEVDRIALLVRAFLEDVSPTFVELAESNFQTVRYFPVSALGTSPELEEKQTASTGNSKRDTLKVRPSRIAPFRVTHPFLWLLFRWGLIRPLKKRPTPIGVEKATVSIDSRFNKMRVVLPSRRVLVLDHEYAEMLIIDPYSGKQVWIPNCEPAIHESKSVLPAPTTSTLSATSLNTLKIQPPATPPQKRGWFKKP